MAGKQDSEATVATVAVNVEELRNSKDAVIMRLMALQSYIADLSKAYLEHANNVINGGPATIDIPSLPVGLSSHFDLGLRATSPAKSEAGGTKKRKRAPVDPNAPKRALTPYFLYMQANRAQIAQDMGPNVSRKEVADEGTRRWQTMEPKEKEVWKQLYQENYETYKVKMAAYKAGQKVDDEQDPAASQLLQDFAGAESAHESESSEEESESEEESPSPQPPKEKTPPRSTNKRRKSDASKPPKESPVKKAKGKNAEPATVTKEKAPESTKRKNKKRKSEA